MRVWIDITNSPHVPFFAPIVDDLRREGHEVIITARDYAQTLELMDASGIAYTRIGRHRGASMLAKSFGLASRSLGLLGFAAGKSIDVALSHNSNDLAVAAWLRRLPHLIVHDYEHARLSYVINARLATRILIPDSIPTERIVAYGARPDRVGHFPGLKEHVYLSAGSERQDLRSEFGADQRLVLVVARPPATMAAYHRFENALFDLTLRRLVDSPNTVVVVLPRTKEQGEQLVAEYGDRIIVPKRVYDGASLISSADLVLSAGGTMNREAAVLGTPAYTVFAGEMGAVDAALIARGLITRVTTPEDVAIRRKSDSKGYWVENRSAIVEELKRLVRR